MKNSDKILFVVALLACVGGCAAYALLAPSSKTVSAPKAARGADVPAWTDASASAEKPAPAWKAPLPDLAEGWNYDLFTSPEISWDSQRKKYFAKDLPPPPEEVFGLTLKSLAHPKFRLVISSYSAGTKPVPEQTSAGRFAAVLTVSDISGARPETRLLNFGTPTAPTFVLSDLTVGGKRTVTLTPETPMTIPKSNAKLKAFRIHRWKDATGAFKEALDAVVIDERGRAPREFVISDVPVDDKNRVEAVFTDGAAEWLYSETRVPGKKEPVCEIVRRDAPDQVENAREIRVGDDVFRIKGLDISAQEARIEKQSSEVDKKTKAPKTTERVLSPQ